MSSIEPQASEKIDLYIAKFEGEQKLLLSEIRSVLNLAEFEMIEDWKWNAPNYKHQGMICWMACFKNHIGLHFFKGSLIPDAHNLYDTACMDKGSRQVKYKSLAEFDAEKLRYYLFEAIALNKKGEKVKAKEINTDVPEDLRVELSKNPIAAAFFNTLADSYKRDYLEWITTAKQEKTRAKRLATTIEWLNEGKKKNWNYEKC